MKFPPPTLTAIQMMIAFSGGYLLALEDLGKDVEDLTGQFNASEEYSEGAASALQSVRDRISDSMDQAMKTVDALHVIEKGMQ